MTLAAKVRPPCVSLHPQLDGADAFGIGIGPNNIATSCEVKARSGDGYGDPREAVGPEKVRRLRRAAEIWLARNPDCLELEIAFEVVGVRGKLIERVPLG